jgi:hypothetical protein
MRDKIRGQELVDHDRIPALVDLGEVATDEGLVLVGGHDGASSHAFTWTSTRSMLSILHPGQFDQITPPG